LEKDPRRRYGSAQALADDLRAWLGSRPIAARRVGTAEHAWLWCKRQPVVAGLAAAMLVIGLVGLSGILWQWRAAVTARIVAEKETEFARRRLYDVRMSQVQQFWDGCNMAAIYEALDEQLPENQRGIDRRGWEWYYWQRRISTGQLHLAHPGVVRYVCYSPDSRRLTTICAEGTVTVWDTATGRAIFTLNKIQSDGEDIIITFSPDSQTLAISRRDGTVTVRDAASGQETPAQKGTVAPVRQFAFSPDGRRLAMIGGDGTIGLWDTATGREILTLKGLSRVPKIMAFSPDSRRFITTGDDGTIGLWDTATGRETLARKGMVAPVRQLAFSPDGRRLVTHSRDGTIGLWDTATGRETHTFKGLVAPDSHAVFSPDGRRLTTHSGDGTINVWDTDAGRATFTLKGVTREFVAISPDGRRLAVRSDDGTVKLWDTAAGREPFMLKGPANVFPTVVFSRDSRRLASGGYKTAKVWDAANGQTIAFVGDRNDPVININMPLIYWGLAIGPDGARLACYAGNTVTAWNPADSQKTRTLEGHAGSVAFSPDGRRLVSAGIDGTIKVVWDAATGQETRALDGDTVPPTNHPSRSLDGSRRAYANGDDVPVYDDATGKSILVLHSNVGPVDCVAISPDGTRIAAGGGRGTVEVWDLATEVARAGRIPTDDGHRDDAARTAPGAVTDPGKIVLKGHNGGVTSVAFSPDGTRIASASRDKTVRVWDALTGQETLTLQEHTGPVHCVAFSPDGTRIASASEDQTVKVWDATPINPDLPGREPTPAAVTVE
jgi:WD40 repeat protein